MSLEILIGPMWASKSTELIKKIKQYKVIGKTILVVNHSFDNRNLNSENSQNLENSIPKQQICTHDNVPYPAVMCSNLETILPISYDYDVILIDEAQFFDDLYKIVLKLVDELDKIVIIAGLSGDTEKRPIGQILLLIPHADKVVHLSALCIKCSDGTLAHFTRKKPNTDPNKFIGGKELYEPLCRYHYKTFPNPF